MKKSLVLLLILLISITLSNCAYSSKEKGGYFKKLHSNLPVDGGYQKLKDGRVLIYAGEAGNIIFDPKTDTFRKTAKAKKLVYDRTSIARKSYLGKRGYKPKGVVIHNDAGSASATQYKNNLVNASNARLEQGIAHSYISGNTVWQALPESYIAWHTA